MAENPIGKSIAADRDVGYTAAMVKTWFAVRYHLANSRKSGKPPPMRTVKTEHVAWSWGKFGLSASACILQVLYGIAAATEVPVILDVKGGQRTHTPFPTCADRPPNHGFSSSFFPSLSLGHPITLSRQNASFCVSVSPWWLFLVRQAGNPGRFPKR